MASTFLIKTINGVLANENGEVAAEDIVGGAAIDLDAPIVIGEDFSLSGLKQPIVTKKIDCTDKNILINIVPSFPGQLYNIKRINGGENIITVVCSGGTIDDQPSIQILTQGDNLQIHFITLTEGIVT